MFHRSTSRFPGSGWVFPRCHTAQLPKLHPLWANVCEGDLDVGRVSPTLFRVFSKQPAFVPLAGLDSLCVGLTEEPPPGCARDGDTGGSCGELSKSSSSPSAALRLLVPLSPLFLLPLPFLLLPPPFFLLSAAEQELNKTFDHKFEITRKAHTSKTSCVP